MVGSGPYTLAVWCFRSYFSGVLFWCFVPWDFCWFVRSRCALFLFAFLLFYLLFSFLVLFLFLFLFLLSSCLFSFLPPPLFFVRFLSLSFFLFPVLYRYVSILLFPSFLPILIHVCLFFFFFVLFLFLFFSVLCFDLVFVCFLHRLCCWGVAIGCIFLVSFSFLS